MTDVYESTLRAELVALRARVAELTDAARAVLAKWPPDDSDFAALRAVLDDVEPGER